MQQRHRGGQVHLDLMIIVDASLTDILPDKSWPWLKVSSRNDARNKRSRKALLALVVWKKIFKMPWSVLAG
jgi:hypothetical protein